MGLTTITLPALHLWRGGGERRILHFSFWDYHIINQPSTNPRPLALSCVGEDHPLSIPTDPHKPTFDIAGTEIRATAGMGNTAAPGGQIPK